MVSFDPVDTMRHAGKFLFLIGSILSGEGVTEEYKDMLKLM